MPILSTVCPGIIVHYVLPRDARKHRPAIVTRVRNNGTLDLHVMTTATGRRSKAFNVRGIVCDPTGRTGKTWHVPEFVAARNVRTIDDVAVEAATYAPAPTPVTASQANTTGPQGDTPAAPTAV